ncbi:hypothetical protein L202_01224 [Cryptococcus amylolentus CBS 6039]|uniref:Uncharacterized protein n=1 Tax=Cryptococcus amylolentus CBS 6039 TaxID=1295533 RepID=A0A1E3I331_9TREE|nr:hypothetical protein L202_01224 [Cryptococcus amylolentus CBS 6039]ODN82992.1 hypothetical protein L202_01224 [Cryptococcus amylolentus CBS 6039]
MPAFHLRVRAGTTKSLVEDLVFCESRMLGRRFYDVWCLVLLERNLARLCYLRPSRCGCGTSEVFWPHKTRCHSILSRGWRAMVALLVRKIKGWWMERAGLDCGECLRVACDWWSIGDKCASGGIPGCDRQAGL